MCVCYIVDGGDLTYDDSHNEESQLAEDPQLNLQMESAVSDVTKGNSHHETGPTEITDSTAEIEHVESSAETGKDGSEQKDLPEIKDTADEEDSTKDDAEVHDNAEKKYDDAEKDDNAETDDAGKEESFDKLQASLYTIHTVGDPSRSLTSVSSSLIETFLHSVLQKTSNQNDSSDSETDSNTSSRNVSKQVLSQIVEDISNHQLGVTEKDATATAKSLVTHLLVQATQQVREQASDDTIPEYTTRSKVTDSMDEIPVSASVPIYQPEKLNELLGHLQALVHTTHTDGNPGRSVTPVPSDLIDTFIQSIPHEAGNNNDSTDSDTFSPNVHKQVLSQIVEVISNQQLVGSEKIVEDPSRSLTSVSSSLKETFLHNILQKASNQNDSSDSETDSNTSSRNVSKQVLSQIVEDISNHQLGGTEKDATVIAESLVIHQPEKLKELIQQLSFLGQLQASRHSMHTDEDPSRSLTSVSSNLIDTFLHSILQEASNQNDNTDLVSKEKDARAIAGNLVTQLLDQASQQVREQTSHDLVLDYTTPTKGTDSVDGIPVSASVPIHQPEQLKELMQQPSFLGQLQASLHSILTDEDLSRSLISVSSNLNDSSDSGDSTDSDTSCPNVSQLVLSQIVEAMSNQHLDGSDKDARAMAESLVTQLLAQARQHVREQTSDDPALEYTTPSRLHQKIADREMTEDVSGKTPSVSEYTTPSRLHQKIADRDMTEDVSGKTPSVSEYTTPSKLHQMITNRELNEEGAQQDSPPGYTTPFIHISGVETDNIDRTKHPSPSELSQKLTHKEDKYDKSSVLASSTPSKLIQKMVDRQVPHDTARRLSMPVYTISTVMDKVNQQRKKEADEDLVGEYSSPFDLLLKVIEQEAANDTNRRHSVPQYTTPSRLHQRVLDREVGNDADRKDPVPQYTTPSRLHQRILDREVGNDADRKDSVPQYTTPSRLHQKVLDREVGNDPERKDLVPDYTVSSNLIEKVDELRKSSQKDLDDMRKESELLVKHSRELAAEMVKNKSDSSCRTPSETEKIIAKGCIPSNGSSTEKEIQTWNGEPMNVLSTASQNDQMWETVQSWLFLHPRSFRDVSDATATRGSGTSSDTWMQAVEGRSFDNLDGGVSTTLSSDRQEEKPWPDEEHKLISHLLAHFTNNQVAPPTHSTGDSMVKGIPLKDDGNGQRKTQTDKNGKIEQRMYSDNNVESTREVGGTLNEEAITKQKYNIPTPPNSTTSLNEIIQSSGITPHDFLVKSIVTLFEKARSVEREHAYASSPSTPNDKSSTGNEKQLEVDTRYDALTKTEQFNKHKDKMDMTVSDIPVKLSKDQASSEVDTFRSAYTWHVNQACSSPPAIPLVSVLGHHGNLKMTGASLPTSRVASPTPDSVSHSKFVTRKYLES